MIGYLLITIGAVVVGLAWSLYLERQARRNAITRLEGLRALLPNATAQRRQQAAIRRSRRLVNAIARERGNT